MSPTDSLAASAVHVRITGIVQGVGFRPFVYRLAMQHGIAGWVRNAEDGVHVVAEGEARAVERFLTALRNEPPPAAHIASFETTRAAPVGFDDFAIRESTGATAPTTRISPDLAVCEDCLRELFDPLDRRFGYPYINCTNCGPRFSIVLSLPYDRERTVMRDWPMCDACRREYADPADRRFHAEPIACPDCGPTVQLEDGSDFVLGRAAIEGAAARLAAGEIVAIKGIGGYHLACDARNATAVQALRERKYRKERPFAVMARDLDEVRQLVDLHADTEQLLTSIERPIVLAPAITNLPGVAPNNRDLGVMLPYTPVHHLLFAAGAPSVLVMTSANRSSEPIAYLDDDARSSLAGIADALLVGQRPIARRLDDSIVRVTSSAPAVLRRARGLAPRVVATFPKTGPILAVGGDLKNALTLVVDGQAFAGPHIGDLDHLSSLDAFHAAVADLCAMYDVRPEDLTIAHDMHPGYRSREFALSLPGKHVAVQHHRAHIASVLAEHDAWDTKVIGFAFDGTGYGDDGTIWGGEVFTGSLRHGLDRCAHMRPALLPGGDAAARFPVQCAAGFLYEIEDCIAFDAPPFSFPERYSRARGLVARGVRVFPTTSIGRLFDTVAAIVGFTREQTFEGQAAMWLEHLARGAAKVEPYPFPCVNSEFDTRPLLRAVIADRAASRPPSQIALAFHEAVAGTIIGLVAASDASRVAASGGVFQNALLIELLDVRLGARFLCNRYVSSNDGGLGLGQAALALRHIEHR